MKKLLYVTTGVLVSLFSTLFVLQIVKAESFEFTPATLSIPKTCEREVDVMVDTVAQHSNAADIEIHYDVTKIEIIDSLPGQAGTQVKPGNAYDAYVFNQVDTVNGIIRVAAGSLSGDLVGRKTFITIRFKSKPGVTSAGFTILFTGVGDTLDSNIAESTTNLDILTFVTNGNYTFVDGFCSPDVLAPVVKINQPSTTTYSGPLHIEAELTDDKSGVDLTTIQIVVNGITFTPSTVVITQTGDKFHYYISLNPAFTVISGTPTTITITVKDFSGNTGSASKLLNPAVPPTSTPVPTATPSVTAIPGTPTPSPTPFICNTDNIPNLPETGDKTSLCQTLIEKEQTKQNLYNLVNVDTTLDGLAAFNRKVPTIGSFGFISLLLLGQSLFLLFSLLWAASKWGNKIGVYQGVLFAKDNGSELINHKVSLFHLDGTKIGDTVTDVHGRYYFDTKPGNYLVKIKGGNFKSIETKINIAHDGKYNYHQLEFKNRGGLLNEQRDRLNWVFIRDTLAFSITALVLATLSVVLDPNPYTNIIFIVNLVLVVFSIISKIWSVFKLGI